MKPRQNEAEYQEIKKILKGSDISSKEQLNVKINGMFKAARLYSLFGCILMITLIVILPKFSIFTVMLFCLLMAWLWSSTMASKNYFQRYLNENSSNKNNNNKIIMMGIENTNKEK